MDRWCRSIGPAVYGAGYPAALHTVSQKLDELPVAVSGALRELDGAAEAHGGVLVRGVPVPADLPPTPSRPFTELRRPVGTEPVLMAAVLALGEIVSFADWHEGDRVQNFYPLREQAHNQNANNSVELELHTETAFRPETPDLVALLCLRADPAVATLYCDVAWCWRGLDAGTRALLGEPAYFFALPDGRRTPGKPIASGAADPPRINFAEALVAQDREHRRALDGLRERIRGATVPVRLEAGDLLMLDNARVVHGRSPIAARYDGTDRWMQRCLGRRVGARSFTAPDGEAAIAR